MEKLEEKLKGKTWRITTQIGGGAGILVALAKLGYEAITGDQSMHSVYSYMSPIIQGAGWGYLIGSGIDSVKYVASKARDYFKQNK